LSRGVTGETRVAFVRTARDGSDEAIARSVPLERPIALEFNGIGYAVMMATPCDLADFAVGFALSERLVAHRDEIIDVECHSTEQGEIVRVTLSAERAPELFARVRHRTSDSSCGLCGIENLEQALRPLPPVPAQPPIAPEAIFRALGALRDHQPLNRSTGAVHAAARCSQDGGILDVREDVGRHNAFDKLIGAMHGAGVDWDGGFALLSSRCSYELVEKAALSGCGTLVTISAATDLAIARAKECGLMLVVLARPDAILTVSA
jgi:FdhD protein